jgi:hypothetical protein
MFKLVTSVRGGSNNSALTTKTYSTVDEARAAAKALMHENQRVVRIMVLSGNGPEAKFVEWIDRS